jgi:peptide-methionine (S)-S-oxide reductase
MNRQGADKGTQYRSIILTHDKEQDETARKIIEEMATYFDDKIVTEVKAFRHFFVAEPYHQKYYTDNPENAYCTAVISPKMKKFKALFKDRLKSQSPE